MSLVCVTGQKALYPWRSTHPAAPDDSIYKFTPKQYLRISPEINKFNRGKKKSGRKHSKAVLGGNNILFFEIK